MAAERDSILGTHDEELARLGQIDVGNAFSTNTVPVTSGNTVLNGGGIKAGGLELGGGTFHGDWQCNPQSRQRHRTRPQCNWSYGYW